MRIVIVIPARFGSTRLPGKPLLDILGKPMIQHVYERASEVKAAHAVIVATDDERVAQAVRGFGGTAMMTSPDHVSGTARIAAMLPFVPGDLFVNVQGDEPLIRPADIDTLIAGMSKDALALVGTLCHRIPAQDAGDPNTVKTVLNDAGEAMYFSRAAIPYARDPQPGLLCLKHIGIYAYRRELLAGYAGIPSCALEDTEKLEQLRLLSAGIRIRAWQVEPTGPGVDTLACLQRVRRLMAAAAGLPGPAEPLPEPMPSDVLQDVRLIITDVDGVLTDGGLYWDLNGECMKRFHARDGLGVQLLHGCDVKVAVLSGRDSPVLRRRVADLGIALAAYGVRDKAAACRELMSLAGVSPAQTAFIGDDSLDLPAFEACGLSYTTADAAPYMKARATRVLDTCGGAGALRELADAVLCAQGRSDVYSTAAGLLSVIRESAAPVQ